MTRANSGSIPPAIASMQAERAELALALLLAAALPPCLEAAGEGPWAKGFRGSYAPPSPPAFPPPPNCLPLAPTPRPVEEGGGVPLPYPAAERIRGRASRSPLSMWSLLPTRGEVRLALLLLGDGADPHTPFPSSPPPIVVEEEVGGGAQTSARDQHTSRMRLMITIRVAAAEVSARPPPPPPEYVSKAGGAAAARRDCSSCGKAPPLLLPLPPPLESVDASPVAEFEDADALPVAEDAAAAAAAEASTGVGRK